MIRSRTYNGSCIETSMPFEMCLTNIYLSLEERQAERKMIMKKLSDTVRKQISKVPIKTVKEVSNSQISF